jgi:hypothetical protein
VHTDDVGVRRARPVLPPHRVSRTRR